MNLNVFNSFYKNKKVLITGDSGFKGSWLAIWLYFLEAKVYGYSLPPKTSFDNYSISKLPDKINHKNADIRNYVELKENIDEIEPEIIFHLAAQPLVIESYRNPHYTIETNLMGTVNILEAVRNQSKVKTVILITSDKCYKNKKWFWGYRENDELGGDDPYSASKGASEIVIQSYLKSFFSEDNSTNVASVRAGNIIGGGDWADHRLIPDFFRSVMNHSNLKIRYPLATRPWQFILDALYGYLLLAKELTADKKYSGAWNFGPAVTSNITVIELIQKVINYFGSGNFKTDFGKNMHEANELYLDSSKAFKLLNWKNNLDIENTVKWTVDGYKDQFNNSDACFESRIKQIESYLKILSET